MKEEEFLRGMTFLGEVYGKRFEESTVRAWYTFFRKEDFDDFRKAVMQICTTSPKMPSVAEIKEAMHPNDEWEKVQELVRKYGYYNAKEAEKEMSPSTLSAVRAMGGFRAICQMPNDKWARKEFMDNYKSERKPKTLMIEGRINTKA